MSTAATLAELVKLSVRSDKRLVIPGTVRRWCDDDCVICELYTNTHVDIALKADLFPSSPFLGMPIYLSVDDSGGPIVLFRELPKVS